MATKKEVQETGKLTAYSDFKFGGDKYKVGDEFTLPKGYSVDHAFAEFRSGGKRAGKETKGTAFSFEEIITNKDEMGRKVEEKQTHRIILPVE